MDGGDLKTAGAGDAFVIAAQRLKAQSPAQEDRPSSREQLDVALASLDEAEIEIRRAREGLAAALDPVRL
ncbi:MAG: hypothetical protein NTV40_06475 [Solirubrobacterales bacterium]|nr:hypothetical protein [Solirubrobacterales bacterium]